MRQNFLRAGFGRQRVISGIPASVPWILVTILAVAALPFTHLPGPAPVKTNPPPEPVVTVETQITSEGYDSHHRSLPFTVYILSHQLSWKLQSATDLEGEQSLLGPELASAINRARDVFCVGTASFEGVTRTEEARAAQRAVQLAQWVSTAIRNPGQTHLFTLNAGQYRGPPELDSTYQRKAILIVTGPHDDEVDLSEGLTAGLERQQQEFPVVYSLLHHYSRSKEWLEALRRHGDSQGQNANRRQLAGSRIRR